MLIYCIFVIDFLDNLSSIKFCDANFQAAIANHKSVSNKFKFTFA